MVRLFVQRIKRAGEGGKKQISELGLQLSVKNHFIASGTRGGEGQLYENSNQWSKFYKSHLSFFYFDNIAFIAVPLWFDKFSTVFTQLSICRPRQ